MTSGSIANRSPASLALPASQWPGRQARRSKKSGHYHLLTVLDGLRGVAEGVGFVPKITIF